MKSTIKNILFLGGTGFLGSNVLHQMSARHPADYKLLVISRRSYPMPVLRKNITYVQADFTNAHDMERIFSGHKIHEVFHFISTTVPANSNSNILKDAEANIISTIRLLDLIVRYDVNKITYLSSGGAIVRDPSPLLFPEDSPYRFRSSYGVVKATTEEYIRLYREIHGINYLIIRPSNPFGLYHHSNINGLVNLSIRRALQAEKMLVWGDGSSEKDYIFSTDFADILCDLHDSGISNTIINIGSGTTLSINDVLLLVKEHIPGFSWTYTKEKSFDTSVSGFFLEQLYSLVSPAYTPTDEAIRRTVEWELARMKSQKTSSKLQINYEW